MNEDFVTYEQAVKLKELGFDVPVNHYYKDNRLIEIYGNLSNYCNANEKYVAGCFSAPTLAQTQKWFMDKKHILISIRPNDFINDSGNAEIHYTADIFGTSKGYLELLHSESGYETYEFALEDSINEALNILETTKK